MLRALICTESRPTENKWSPDPASLAGIVSEGRAIVDLITKLLVKDPAQRLGTQGGMNEILAHPWGDPIFK